MRLGGRPQGGLLQELGRRLARPCRSAPCARPEQACDVVAHPGQWGGCGEGFRGRIRHLAGASTLHPASRPTCRPQGGLLQERGMGQVQWERPLCANGGSGCRDRLRRACRFSVRSQKGVRDNFRFGNRWVLKRYRGQFRAGKRARENCPWHHSGNDRASCSAATGFGPACLAGHLGGMGGSATRLHSTACRRSSFASEPTPGKPRHAH
jgi:hypothetical protein